MKALRMVIVALVVPIFSVTGIALADHDGHEFETAEECMASSRAPDRMATCTRSNEGPWVAHYGSLGGERVPGAFGGFLVLALLWAALPAVIGGFVASGRGQSVGLAVILGLVLGWIGLLIVVFALKPEVSAAAKSLIDAASQAGPNPSSDRRDPASRLQELDRLKDEKRVTQEEYESLRAAILRDI